MSFIFYDYLINRFLLYWKKDLLEKVRVDIVWYMHCLGIFPRF